MTAHFPSPVLGRHDTTVEINSHVFRISYLWQVRKIIFTRMDGLDAGCFEVTRPPASRQPADFILQTELENYLQANQHNLERTH